MTILMGFRPYRTVIVYGSRISSANRGAEKYTRNGIDTPITASTDASDRF